MELAVLVQLKVQTVLVETAVVEPLVISQVQQHPQVTLHTLVVEVAEQEVLGLVDAVDQVVVVEE